MNSDMLIELFGSEEVVNVFFAARHITEEEVRAGNLVTMVGEREEAWRACALIVERAANGDEWAKAQKLRSIARVAGMDAALREGMRQQLMTATCPDDVADLFGGEDAAELFLAVRRATEERLRAGEAMEVLNERNHLSYLCTLILELEDSGDEWAEARKPRLLARIAGMDAALGLDA